MLDLTLLNAPILVRLFILKFCSNNLGDLVTEIIISVF